MREYQQAYVENLERIVALSDLSGETLEDGAAFLAGRREKNARVQEIVEENTVMLRQKLFPVLDDIASADEEEIRHLEDFARHLGGTGANQLDPVLHYSIHCALITYARKWEKRDMLIRELYQAGLALFYMQEIIDRSGKVRYRWKMGLLFGEAASYIRQYDEIKSSETRGYIHRSMGNLSLAYGGANREDARRKLDAVRRSLQILTDPAFQEKTPSLPWEQYIYVSHQERSSALNVLRAGISEPLLLKEVMESAEYVWEHQEEYCRKKGTRPMVRWRMGYEAAQYHCGILPLGDLLHWLEEVYMERDEEDYSENGIYSNISIPALYAEYLSNSEQYRFKKREVLSHMYRRVADYVRSAPEEQVGELLLKYLLVFLQSFVEYPDGIQEKEFLLQLVICRHPDAYVFSRMVARITELMAGHALRETPELLLGILGCDTPKQLQKREKEILRFAYESGLLHDIGILAFNNMVRRIGRSWLEEEREMVEYHVYAGASILEKSESTRPYAASALGHHRFFDGSGGYPAEYDRKKNTAQAVTDMVSAAAFLVRLIDDTNYQSRRCLSLQQALKQVKEQAGIRLSPAAAGLLIKMEEELKECLQSVQMEAYEEAFRLLKG
ncbi:MAG: HD domain-containing protein [Provencibacterium sp.]|nr:HD domain-containing protein [Provencibacterium sp.]